MRMTRTKTRYFYVMYYCVVIANYIVVINNAHIITCHRLRLSVSRGIIVSAAAKRRSSFMSDSEDGEDEDNDDNEGEEEDDEGEGEEEEEEEEKFNVGDKSATSII